MLERAIILLCEVHAHQLCDQFTNCRHHGGGNLALNMRPLSMFATLFVLLQLPVWAIEVYGI